MIKNILKNSLIALSLLSTPALADYSFESEVNYDVQIEKIRFQALLRIGQTVTVGELLEFTNGPRVTYDEVPDGNMRSLLKKMKRGVKDEDVAHYFWDFFHRCDQASSALQSRQCFSRSPRVSSSRRCMRYNQLRQRPSTSHSLFTGSQRVFNRV